MFSTQPPHHFTTMVAAQAFYDSLGFASEGSGNQATPQVFGKFITDGNTMLVGRFWELRDRLVTAGQAVLDGTLDLINDNLYWLVESDPSMVVIPYPFVRATSYTSLSAVQIAFAASPFPAKLVVHQGAIIASLDVGASLTGLYLQFYQQAAGFRTVKPVTDQSLPGDD